MDKQAKNRVVALVPVSRAPRARFSAAPAVRSSRASRALATAPGAGSAPKCPTCGDPLQLGGPSSMTLGAFRLDLCPRCAVAGQQLLRILSRLVGPPKGGSR